MNEMLLIALKVGQNPRRILYLFDELYELSEVDQAALLKTGHVDGWHAVLEAETTVKMELGTELNQILDQINQLDQVDATAAERLQEKMTPHIMNIAGDITALIQNESATKAHIQAENASIELFIASIKQITASVDRATTDNEGRIHHMIIIQNTLTDSMMQVARQKLKETHRNRQRAADALTNKTAKRMQELVHEKTKNLLFGGDPSQAK